MQFEKGYIYHIYNQGNNRQQIFFNRENYLYFLRKINAYILPYADILSWCLMPNHFHLMVYVREEEIDASIWDVTQGSETHTIHQMTQSHLMDSMGKKRSLSNSIAIMLRSYTRAINKQNNQTGSLFRPHTKAECVNCPNGITPNFINKQGGAQINISIPEREYPQICFDYIHKNPTRAKLVQRNEDWEFSSAQDYLGLRNGKLINKELAKEYVTIN